MTTTATPAATVSADVFVPIVNELLKTREMTIHALSVRCNVREDSLLKALSKRVEIDFDLCDLILCRLGVPHMWWSEPLSDVYWSLKFVEGEEEIVCASAGCTRTFTLGRFHPRSGPKRKKYCSAACRPKQQ